MAKQRFLKIAASILSADSVWWMADELGISTELVVGKLVRVWSWWQSHGDEVYLLGPAREAIDVQASCEGFSEAMEHAGLLVNEDDGWHMFSHENAAKAKPKGDK